MTKTFGQVHAVEGVSFDAPSGQVTGFLGPNGAGKTTTLRVLLGLEQPAAGSAVIGVAVGTFTRNLVLGIVGALAWLYVIEGIVVSAFADVGRWLPSGAASAVGNAVKDGLLPPVGRCSHARRLRRGDQTLREHLIATAARLISERGGAGLTVREIAREAQVADGVLYNHFGAKEKLLAAGLRAHVHGVMAGLGEAPRPGTGTLADNLHAYITRGLGVLTRIMPAFAGMISQPKVLMHFHAHGLPMHEHALPRALAQYLRAEQKLGRVSPTALPEAAASMIIGACHELVLPRVFQGSPLTDFTVPEGFVDDLVTTVLHGIAPPPSDR